MTPEQRANAISLDPNAQGGTIRQQIAYAIKAAVKYERERCVRIARRHGDVGLAVAEKIQDPARVLRGPLRRRA